MSADKSIGAVLSETKEELKEFLRTRLEILQADLGEKLVTWKREIPLLVLAAALVSAGWLALAFAAAALIHVWFLPSPYAWWWGGAMVAVVYLIAGIALGRWAYAKVSAAGVTPRHTLEVLKQDQLIMRDETRAA